MLTVPERHRVDAATSGTPELLHRESIDELIRDVRTGAARMLLLSVASCYPYPATRMAHRLKRLLREYPSVTAIALVTDLAGWSPEAVLALGRIGVSMLVDARDSHGWRALRTALDDLVFDFTRVEQLAIEQLSRDLNDAPYDCRRFFASLFTAPPEIRRIAELARFLDVPLRILTRRFEVAALPAANAYLAAARLVRLAGALENPAVSMTRAAAPVALSSRQALARFIRRHCQMPASQFRRQYNGVKMLERFRRELVLPHLGALRRFRPLR